LFAQSAGFVITAKLVGTETSRIESVLVKAGKDADLGEMAIELSAKIDERITKEGLNLTGADMVKPDPLPKLLESVSKKKRKLVFAVVVTEEHIAGPRRQQPSLS